MMRFGSARWADAGCTAAAANNDAIARDRKDGVMKPSSREGTAPDAFAPRSRLGTNPEDDHLGNARGVHPVRVGPPRPYCVQGGAGRQEDGTEIPSVRREHGPLRRLVQRTGEVDP